MSRHPWVAPKKSVLHSSTVGFAVQGVGEMGSQTGIEAALVIDDHELFRFALTDMLVNAIGFPRAFGCGSIDEAIHLLDTHPEIAFATLDLRLPGMDDPAVIRVLCETYPHLRIAVVSGSATRNEAIDSVRSGALGFVPKSLPATEIQAVLKRILAGEVYLPPQVTKAGDSIFVLEARPEPPVGKSLTHRQVEVHRLLRAGMSNKLIARQLNLSENTIKVHVYAICRVLGVRDRHEAARIEPALGVAASVPAMPSPTGPRAVS